MAWTVYLCSACERAFGGQGKSRACVHCNHTEAKVLSKHEKASDARDAVSLANTPPEIRDQLSGWMAKERLREAPLPVQAVDGASVLSAATEEGRIVTLESVEKALAAHNSVMDPEAFIEQACAEGELLRLADGRWKRA